MPHLRVPSSRLQVLGLTALLGFLALTNQGCAHSSKVPRGLLPLTMIEVAGGTFTMGDEFDYEDIDATPVHPATVADFRIAATEVTYEQYDAFATKFKLPKPTSIATRGNRAVVNVTWDEARAFCAAYGFRLPTEPEWEFAARDRGRKTLYPGTNDESKADAYVGHADNSDERRTEVMQRLPNELGLYDMGGNVFEWVADYYPFYPLPEDAPEYKDLSTVGMRAVRGGSVRIPLEAARTYRRASTLSTVRSNVVGFRCAAD